MYTYVGEIESTARFGGFLLGLIFFVFAIYIVFAILAVAVIILRLVSNYKLFQRAGLEGWRQFIPIYGSWCRAKIAFGNGYEYIGLMPWIQILFCFIPYIDWVASIVCAAQSMYIQYKYAASFGASPILQIVTSLTEVIGEQILAFGKQYRYIGCQKEVLGLPRMNNQNNQYQQYQNGYEQYQNGYGQYQNNQGQYQNGYEQGQPGYNQYQNGYGQYQNNGPIYQEYQGTQNMNPGYGNTNPGCVESTVQNPDDHNSIEPEQSKNAVDTEENNAINLKKDDETDSNDK